MNINTFVQYIDTMHTCMFVNSPQGCGGGVLHLFIIPRGERGGGEQSPGTSQRQLRAGGGTKKSKLQVSLGLCTSAPGAPPVSVSVIIFLCLFASLSVNLPRCLSVILQTGFCQNLSTPEA